MLSTKPQHISTMMTICTWQGRTYRAPVPLPVPPPSSCPITRLPLEDHIGARALDLDSTARRLWCHRDHEHDNANHDKGKEPQQPRGERGREVLLLRGMESSKIASVLPWLLREGGHDEDDSRQRAARRRQEVRDGNPQPRWEAQETGREGCLIPLTNTAIGGQVSLHKEEDGKCAGADAERPRRRRHGRLLIRLEEDYGQKDLLSIFL